MDDGCQYTYDIETNGTGASTTGNIYGIYDMSGGAWEYVMANYNDVIGNSGFISMPESKYYDKYTSNDVNTACNGNECLSHALSETSSWYNISHNLVSEVLPWLMRGGSHNMESGIFLYSSTVNLGGVSGNISFRLVATIR